MEHYHLPKLTHTTNHCTILLAISEEPSWIAIVSSLCPFSACYRHLCSNLQHYIKPRWLCLPSSSNCVCSLLNSQEVIFPLCFWCDRLYLLGAQQNSTPSLYHIKSFIKLLRDIGSHLPLYLLITFEKDTNLKFQGSGNIIRVKH
jgi:hypothetical protein